MLITLNMINLLIILCLLGTSSALTTITFHDDPEFGDQGTPWRVATCVRFNLDSVKFAEAAKLKSDGGKACIIVYRSDGCHGNRVEVREATVDMENFRGAQSMSPCGSYEADPETTDETIHNHLGKFTRALKNDLITVYNEESTAGSTWFQKTLPAAVEYINKTYGGIGSSRNNRLVVYLMQVSQVFGTSQFTAFDDRDGFRNAARIFGEGIQDGSTRGRPKVHWMFDQVWNSIGCLLSQANNNVYSTVAENVWNNCLSFAHIFKYDMYLALGFKDDAARVKRDLLNYKRNSPRENTFWFRDWLLPVYEKYGQAKAYDTFLKLLAKNFPTKLRRVNGQDVGKEYARRLNIGEFVHFFSGAAGENLKDLARKAFGWNADWEDQLQRAQREFTAFKYSG